MLRQGYSGWVVAARWLGREEEFERVHRAHEQELEELQSRIRMDHTVAVGQVVMQVAVVTGSMHRIQGTL